MDNSYQTGVLGEIALDSYNVILENSNNADVAAMARECCLLQSSSFGGYLCPALQPGIFFVVSK
jgi:hypothetical protein